MWHVRAKFDIALKAIKPPPRNVFLSCNYCGENICTALDQRNNKNTTTIQTKDQTSESGSSNTKVCQTYYWSVVCTNKQIHGL